MDNVPVLVYLQVANWCWESIRSPFDSFGDSAAIAVQVQCSNASAERQMSSFCKVINFSHTSSLTDSSISQTQDSTTVGTISHQRSLAMIWTNNSRRGQLYKQQEPFVTAQWLRNEKTINKWVALSRFGCDTNFHLHSNGNERKIKEIHLERLARRVVKDPGWPWVSNLPL